MKYCISDFLTRFLGLCADRGFDVWKWGLSKMEGSIVPCETITKLSHVLPLYAAIGRG